MQSPPPPPPPPGGGHDPLAPPPPSISGPPAAPIAYAAPITYAGQTTYAGFWIRVLARIFDAVLLGIPFGVIFGVFAVVGGIMASSSGSTDQNSQGAAGAVLGGAFILLYLFFLVVTVGYWIYYWGSSGATFGMRLLHLRVIDANTGGPIGYGRAAARFLMSIVNSWACYLGWIWVAIDPRKQGWHDKVANSVVIHY